jgi:1-acyl-sn-glycerol-3-phosphate acyltransferase
MVALRPSRPRNPILPATVFAPLLRSLGDAIQQGLNEDPFQRDPAFIRRILPLVKSINLYFGTEIRGWNNVPGKGPFLIVGNHSGGAGTSDTAPLLAKWVEDRGSADPLYSLGYDLLFTYPVIGPWLRKLGVLPANHDNAREAVRRSAAVVVFPGGDYEVFRPWTERNRIEFGGHKGFVQLALATGVQVVPMTIHGAHQSTVVLTRGRRLARATGLSRLRIKVFPFVWNIPLGPAPAFVPSLQLPAKVTVEFGKPLDWSHYGRKAAHDQGVVQKCYDEITRTMQFTLNALAEERPNPILMRLNELRPSRSVRDFLSSAPRRGGDPQPPRRREVTGRLPARSRISLDGSPRAARAAARAHSPARGGERTAVRV